MFFFCSLLWELNIGMKMKWISNILLLLVYSHPHWSVLYQQYKMIDYWYLFWSMINRSINLLKFQWWIVQVICWYIFLGSLKRQKKKIELLNKILMVRGGSKRTSKFVKRRGEVCFCVCVYKFVNYPL